MIEESICEICGIVQSKEIEDKIDYIYGNMFCECVIAEEFVELKKEIKKLKRNIKELKQEQK